MLPWTILAPNAKGWKQPFPLTPIITGTIQQTGRPFTSSMSQDAVNKVNRLYGAYDAQQQGAKLRQKLQIAPGFIRPRGVEEQNATEGNQTVDEQGGTEKKP